MKIELDPFEQLLILEYGYPDPQLKAQITALPRGDSGMISFRDFDIDMVSGDLSRSINHGEVPDTLIYAVDALCRRLEVYL